MNKIALLLLFAIPSLTLAAKPTHSLPIDLSAFFNNDGIATKENPTDGNLDGAGYSYPAEYLPNAGLTTLGGMRFLFPSARLGDRNNVIADGQLITLPAGHYHAASLLVAATYSSVAGTITLHYADGKSGSFNFDVSDWYTDPSGIIVAPFRYTPEGQKDEHPVFMGALRLPIDYRRKLIAISLPTAPNAPRQLHLFALTLHPVVVGTALDFFSLEAGPLVTTEQKERQKIRLTVQNLGTEWITRLHRIRIVVEAPDVKTIVPGRIISLPPGEILQTEVELETTLPRGTEIAGVAKALGLGEVMASLPISMFLGAPDYTSDVASLAGHPSASWFEAAKFGIFIHWGVYTVPAWAPVGGVFAEWYWESMNDLTSAIHHYHSQTYGPQFAYDDFISRFKPSHFDPKEWVELIKESGARYFVYTAKHHDGFAMYGSMTTNRNAVALGPQRDTLRELFAAAEVYAPELKRGIYYSLFEWFHPAYTGQSPINPYTRELITYTGAWPIVNYVRDHMQLQMRELIDWYDPDLFWCDGEGGQGSSYWQTGQMIAHFYNQAKNRARSKDVVANNRCGVAEPQRSRFGADFLTIEYDTFRTIIPKKWEMTRGLDPHSFGFNSATPAEAYLSTNEAIDLLVDVVSKNGNLLLNIGPTSDGSIPAVMRNRLLEIGYWLKINGEAIFETTYWWRTSEEGDLRFTIKPNEAFYIIALNWPGKQLAIESPIPIRRSQTIRLLGNTAHELRWRLEEGKLIVDLPPDESITGRYAWVFKIQ